VLCLATPAYSCPLLEPRCLPHLLTSDRRMMCWIDCRAHGLTTRTLRLPAPQAPLHAHRHLHWNAAKEPEGLLGGRGVLQPASHTHRLPYLASSTSCLRVRTPLCCCHKARTLHGKRPRFFLPSQCLRVPFPRGWCRDCPAPFPVFPPLGPQCLHCSRCTLRPALARPTLH